MFCFCLVCWKCWSVDFLFMVFTAPRTLLKAKPGIKQIWGLILLFTCIDKTRIVIPLTSYKLFLIYIGIK